MPRIPRLVLALLLAAALATTAAWADGPRPASRGSSITTSAPADILAHLWIFLTGLWSKNGCEVDPHGNCLPGTGSATPTGKNGCHVDPSGQCLPGTGSATPTADNGCHVDPDGHCLP